VTLLSSYFPVIRSDFYIVRKINDICLFFGMVFFTGSVNISRLKFKFTPPCSLPTVNVYTVTKHSNST